MTNTRWKVSSFVTRECGLVMTNSRKKASSFVTQKCQPRSDVLQTKNNNRIANSKNRTELLSINKGSQPDRIKIVCTIKLKMQSYAAIKK
jgi:hypothetical protein